MFIIFCICGSDSIIVKSKLFFYLCSFDAFKMGKAFFSLCSFDAFKMRRYIKDNFTEVCFPLDLNVVKMAHKMIIYVYRVTN